MSRKNRDFMRLVVFFDLPTVTKKDKRAYILFRRFLLQNGYNMLQLSVYSRVANGHEGVQKHLYRLYGNLPSKGSVRCLQVTEKQFANMKILVGRPTFEERKTSGRQMFLF